MNWWYIKKEGVYLTTSLEIIEDYSYILEIHLTTRRFDSNKDIAKWWDSESDASRYARRNRVRDVVVVKE